MIERIEVVDRDDKPTGQSTTIQEGDAQGLLHRVAAVFVFDKDGNLLLQSHEKSNSQLDHTVGGHISAGETYEQGAQREMEEEIALVAPLNIVKLSVFSDEQFPNAPDKIVHMFGIFETKAPAGWEFRTTEEVNKLVPMAIEKIVQMMNKEPQKFTRGFINTLSAYIKVNNLPFKIDADSCRKNWSKL